MSCAAIYESTFTTRYGYCDQQENMSLSYLLKEAQQASMEHCEALHVGLDYLKPRKRAFLLARQSVSIRRMPKGGEQVRVRTQPTVWGFVYPRRTSMFSLSGEELAQIDATWVLVDTATRRIQRKTPEDMAGLFPTQKPAASAKLPKISRPCLELPFRVPLHMTDSNRHLNNASYADLLTDLLADRLLQGETIKGLDICYHRELKMGEAFLLRMQDDGSSVLIDGVKDGLCHFESLLTF